MRLSVLSENIAKPGFEAEHGLSYLLEIDNRKVLFDTGQSDLYLRNAKRLGIDIQNDLSTVVLSHGHWDHGNGLQFISDKELIVHPRAFQKRYNKDQSLSIGLPFTLEEYKSNNRVMLSESPYQITDHLWFLGEIPRIIGFESRTTPFKLENGDPDYVEDDSALVAIVNKELIIISGCAHSGICNICEYAKEFTGINKIRMLIGGFHLRYLNRQTRQTIQYFKKQQVRELLPSHCTSFSVLSEFNSNYEATQVKAGNVYNIGP